MIYDIYWRPDDLYHQRVLKKMHLLYFVCCGRLSLALLSCDATRNTSSSFPSDEFPPSWCISTPRSAYVFRYTSDIFPGIHLINVFVFFILLRTSTWNRLLMESRWSLTIDQFSKSHNVHHLFRFCTTHGAYFIYLTRCCCRVYCVMACTILY